MKTTNAKAFQTPGALQGTTKPVKSGKRGSTARKLKQSAPKQESVLQTLKNVEAEEEVPDIEYAPPNPERKLGILRLKICEIIFTDCTCSASGRP